MSVAALDTEEDTVVTPGDRVLLGCRISVGSAFTGEGLSRSLSLMAAGGGQRPSVVLCSHSSSAFGTPES